MESPMEATKYITMVLQKGLLYSYVVMNEPQVATNMT